MEKEKLLQIINYCSHCDIQLKGISTNGSIYDKEISRALRGLNNFSLQVSIDAATSRTYLIIRNSQDFLRVIENTRRFVKDGLNVTMSMVLTRMNSQEIGMFAKLAEQLGAKQLSFGGFIPLGRGKDIGHWSLNYFEILKSYRVIKELKTNVKIIGFEDQYCPAGTKSLDMLPNGDLYPCALFFGFKESKIGNILDETFDSLRSWVKNLINFKVPNKCKNCPMPPVCHGGCKAFIYSRLRKFPERLNPWCSPQKINLKEK